MRRPLSLYAQQRAARIGGDQPVQDLPHIATFAQPAPQSVPDAAPTAPLTQPL